MASSDITALRKSGNLSAAYDLAKNEFRENPDDIWTKRALSWCLYEYLKKNASVENKDDFFDYLLELKNLDLAVDEKILFENVIWCINSLLTDFTNKRQQDNDYICKLFNVITLLPFTRQTKEYSVLMQAFLRSADLWNGFTNFCDWWGFENFTQNDYNRGRSNNGNEIISLVERVYIKYSKDAILKYQHGMINADYIKAFVDKLSIIIRQHPEYQYPLYYKAKLLLTIGENENVTEVLRPIVKSKQFDFWVWDILGDAATDTEMQFSCYCKGLTCRSKEEMMIGLREKIIASLVERNLFNEAKWQVESAVNTRMAQGWKITTKLVDYQKQKWFNDANAANANPNIFKENCKLAESFLFQDMPQVAILVTRVNFEKRILNFITENKHIGFLSYAKLLRRTPKENDVLLCRMEYQLNDQKSTAYEILETTDSVYVSKFIKNSTGILNVTNKGFGFISDEIFVSAVLVGNHADGDHVQYCAAISYDKKKGKWGWRAVKVE